MSRVLILDGGLGTSLEQKYHVNFGKSTPLWSSDLLASDPDTLLACQRAFGEVPVDIMLTATYQVSVDGFSKTMSDSFPSGIDPTSIAKFLEDAVCIAEKAKRPEAQIALSLGPYGACMVPSQEYTGKYDAEHRSTSSLEVWHRDRMELFAAIGDLKSRVSYVALETIPRIDEITAARQALGSVPQLAGLPFWICSLFPGDDDAIPDGHSAEEVVREMLNPDVDAPLPWGIGINCTKIWKLDSLVTSYETAVSRMIREGQIHEWPALLLYPDGTNGEVYNTTTQQWEMPNDSSAESRAPWEEQLARLVRDVLARGKWRQVVVGGCCMASPDHIKRLRSLLLP